jgi:hypothetical protein
MLPSIWSTLAATSASATSIRLPQLLKRNSTTSPRLQTIDRLDSALDRRARCRGASSHRRDGQPSKRCSSALPQTSNTRGCETPRQVDRETVGHAQRREQIPRSTDGVARPATRPAPARRVRHRRRDLIVARDNSARIRREGVFATLVGISPVLAGAGLTARSAGPTAADIDS